MAAEKSAQAAMAATVTQESDSLLDQVLEATPSAQQDRVKDWMTALAEQVSSGTISWDKNVTRTLRRSVEAIDELISKQLAAIVHHPDFQKLEGTWRGLNYLVHNSQTGTNLKVKVLNTTKRELFKDLDSAAEFDQSILFKKLYEDQFGLAGGEPYGALIGDYEFSNHPEDVDMLTKISGAAAAAFLSSAGPAMFGLKSYTELAKPRDLAKIFESPDYTSWRSFRESDDSRFVTLTLPRVLARLPYGKATKPVDEFDFEEGELDSKGRPRAMVHEDYCWMNAAYVLGVRLTNAFTSTGWCTAIRGAENGGKVESLPVHVFKSDDGDTDAKCPTEVPITDRREAELSNLGFLPLCHYKNQDYAVFFGAQTAQKPKVYDKPAATANASIAARLPYIMASSRIAHHLKIIARDRIGSFLEPTDCQDWLNNWISNYVCKDDKPSAEMKARYPLADANIEVKEIPGKPGSYNAVAHLRPWLQMEELTSSLRLVASIPKTKS